MANYHGMQIHPDRDEIRIAFHIPVPDEDNAAGVNLRTALKAWLESERGGITTSEVPWLETSDPTEYTAVVAGEIYELVEWMEFDANASNSEKQAEMDAYFEVLEASVPDKLREQLKFWGKDRDVP